MCIRLAHMENTRNISWAETDELVGKLASDIMRSGFKPDCLIGITVGGLIPLALLSKKLNITNVATISAHSYENGAQKELRITNVPNIDLKDLNVLLVDEIADSGTTLAEIAKVLRERCGARELKTATLAVRTDTCKTRPDFSTFDADRWIVFPWEVGESAVHTVR